MKQFKKEEWPELPKWPAIATVGESVTIEQAKEIIIRTDGLWFSTNDNQFESQLYHAMGVNKNDYEAAESMRIKVKSLDISYLENSRIVSWYVGGPHGWCSWTGKIIDYGRNVGKWPSCEEVHREWCEIAEAFPFLTLKSQLFNKENCQAMEDGFEPVIEFHIKNGKVKVYKPEEPLISKNVMEGDLDIFTIMNPGRERGCTIEQFKDALDYVMDKYN
jgi:hypothetical protein